MMLLWKLEVILVFSLHQVNKVYRFLYCKTVVVVEDLGDHFQVRNFFFEYGL